MHSAEAALLCLAALAGGGGAAGQESGVLSVAPAQKLIARRGGAAEARIRVQLRTGYHVNSNTPSEDYLIPLRLTWQAAPLEVAEVIFPKPVMERYSFSPKPISVFTGDFDIVTRFRVPAGAPAGPAVMAGKLRYQACNHNSCLPPKTIEFRLPASVQ